MLTKTTDSLYVFPYHHHKDIRNSANQFLGFLEKEKKMGKKKERERERKNERNKPVGIQVDCALFKVLD